MSGKIYTVHPMQEFKVYLLYGGFLGIIFNIWIALYKINIFMQYHEKQFIYIYVYIFSWSTVYYIIRYTILRIMSIIILGNGNAYMLIFRFWLTVLVSYARLSIIRISNCTIISFSPDFHREIWAIIFFCNVNKIVFKEHGTVQIMSDSACVIEILMTVCIQAWMCIWWVKVV